MRNYWIASAVGMAVTCLTAAVPFLNDSFDLFDKLFDEKKNKNLMLTQTRMLPFSKARTRADDEDIVFLDFRLMNLGAESVVLTSASLEAIKSNKNVNVERSAASGPCTLSSKPNGVNPLLFEAGEAKWITLSTPLRMGGLPGIINSLVDEISIDSRDGSLVIDHRKYIENVNSVFKEYYGDDAGIRVTFYEGLGDVVNVFDVQFKQGVMLYDGSGNFAHDFLLETWVSGKVPLLSNDCLTQASLY